MALFLIAAAAIAAIVAVIWLIGANEPVYRIIRGAAWFVAVRGEAPALAPGVRVTWSARADFAFIGGDDPYWSHFYILAGGDPSQAPIELTNAEDAYVARIAFAAPPKFALGVLRLATMLGIPGKPSGHVGGDIQSKRYRADVMPDHAAIQRLLAQPPAYAPNMVNFLSYFGGARYPDGRASSGRAAYARYGMVALRTVYRTGGRLLFFGRVLEVLREASSGPTVGGWSDVAAMHYPNPSAILSMEQVAAYRAALLHRDAGLERTIVIAST